MDSQTFLLTTEALFILLQSDCIDWVRTPVKFAVLELSVSDVSSLSSNPKWEKHHAEKMNSNLDVLLENPDKERRVRRITGYDVENPSNLKPYELRSIALANGFSTKIIDKDNLWGILLTAGVSEEKWPCKSYCAYEKLAKMLIFHHTQSGVKPSHALTAPEYSSLCDIVCKKLAIDFKTMKDLHTPLL